MLPFPSSFAAIEAGFVIPTLAGLSAFAVLGRRTRPGYLAAFALGVYLWFFSDTVGGASYLDVNSGFTGGAAQVALLALFVFGAVLPFSLDRRAFAGAPSGTSLVVPALVAFAVGVHGFGEGAAFSVTAANTASTGLLATFGGLGAAVAFLLHKAIEPMMIGAVYWAYAGERARNPGTLVKDILLLTLVFVAPGTLGASTDYFLNYDTTYFFALGTGTSIYAAVRLAKPLFLGAGTSGQDSVKTVLLIALGLLSIYFAALFHS